MDGNLSSLLNLDQFRHDCFSQHRDMKAMDPVELLGILPTFILANSAPGKYLAILVRSRDDSLLVPDSLIFFELKIDTNILLFR
uniref:Uncharacterized protein n=1 Tax=Salix viminalis TaxID=40686 RepID=A0A6N2MI70_SALVM